MEGYGDLELLIDTKDWTVMSITASFFRAAEVAQTRTRPDFIVYLSSIGKWEFTCP